MELALVFDEDGPLYLQIYRQMRSLIRDGVLPDGVKLPSIRTLTKQLSVSKTTVETAYHMLADEGYVHSRERSGLVVVNPQPVRPFPPQVSRDACEPERTAMPALRAEADAIIDFSLLTVDGDAFPLRLWRSVQGEAISLHGRTIHEYGDSRGESGLRESLTHYLRRSRGVECAPEQIVVGSGMAYSIGLLAKLLGEDLPVGVERSGIAQVRQIFAQHGFQLSPFAAEDDDWLDEVRGEPLRLLYVTPSHRPTGEALPYGIRRRMLEWAYRHQGFIIEDDYDGELRLSGRPLPSLQGMDGEGAVIYIGSFSKVFTPALRLNYTVLPERLLSRLREIEPALTPPSRIEQWAMQSFMDGGHWFRHLRRMRKTYRAKRDALIRLVRSHLPDAVRIAGGEAGLHLELSVDAGISADTLIERARQEGVKVYGSQDADDRALIGSAKVYLGFGGITMQEMERGVRLLQQAWASVL